jgi:hypothetical protein
MANIETGVDQNDKKGSHLRSASTSPHPLIDITNKSKGKHKRQKIITSDWVHL